MSGLSVKKAEQSNALEKRYLDKLLKLRPDLGEKAQDYIHSLTETGISSTEGLMILDAVYSSNYGGRGQSGRAKWFCEAVRNRYGTRLERMANNLQMFRGFLTEMEQISESRDNLRESIGLGFSFHEMMMLNEIGAAAEEVAALFDDLKVAPIVGKMRIMQACRSVMNGQFATLEGALFQGSRELTMNDE